MRCLRCAIDYPPGERYCHRCGRALSRPPGSTEAGDVSTTPHDNAYVYSTHAPPHVGDQSAAETPAIVVEPPEIPVSSTYSTPSAYRAPRHPAGETDARPAGADQAHAGVDTLPWDTSRSGRLPADEDEDGDLPRGQRPSYIGIDTSHWRGVARRRTGTRRLLILAAALPLLIALIVALLALTRHNAYGSDLHAARGYLAAGNYSAALASYQAAIGDWPFNSTARDEMAAARAQATVTAQRAQSVVATSAMRDGMFGDRATRRLASAQQADAEAVATATAAVQVATAAAHATAAAGQTATVVAQAQATGAARAHATGTVVAAALGTARAEASATVVTLARGAAPVVYADLSASDGVGVGANHPATESWVADLAQRLPSGSTLINPSLAGADLSYGVQSELPAVVAGHPSLVTIWLVVNDIKDRVPLAAYKAELDTLLGTLRSQTHAAIYIGNAPDLTLVPIFRSLDRTQLTATVQAYNAVVAQEAALHKATLVDLYSESQRTLPAHPEYISSLDGFHPSTLGYADLANYWWSVIQGSAH